MSIHGACFDNGQAGNCGEACSEFQTGQCNIGDEIVQSIHDDLTPAQREVELQIFFEPVKLFVLRGKGASDLDLLLEAYGYKNETMEHQNQHCK